MAENNKLKYDSTVNTSSKGTAILGRLTGPCADIIHPTRNGRKYSEELWEKVFKDPIVQEYFDCGGIFGELNHPADREETDLTKVCICMPEPPKKNSDGILIGSWDILDTPNGRILKCLCDYGYKIGISSRGSGDTFTDSNGQEAVDPDSYSFQGFDIVYLPAVKNARLQYESLHESYNKNVKSFKTALQEQFKRSNVNDKRIMAETLRKLNINYFSEKENNYIANSKQVPIIEAINKGSRKEALVEELQNTLKENRNLQKEITSLKEQLSVCYTKESAYKTKLENSDYSIFELSQNHDTLNEEVENLKNLNMSLTEELADSKKYIEELNCKLKDQQILITKNNSSISRLTEEVKKNKAIQSNSKLLQEKLISEELQKRNKEIETLNDSVSKLQETLVLSKDKIKSLEESCAKYEENLAEAEKDLQIKKSNYQAKLSEEKALTEQYKLLAQQAVDHYVENKAIILGVNEEDIKNRLSENYSFDEIDAICENLQQYTLNMNKLPFSSAAKKEQKVEMKITESINDNIFTSKFDDDIDDSLLSLARL